MPSPDARLGAPVEAAQLATLLAAVAHLGAADRACPGALGLYVVANRITGLASGIYRYRPRTNALAPVEAAQSARRLASCAAEPAALLAADAVLGFAAGAARGGPPRHALPRAATDGLGPVKSAYRAVRSAGALGLTGTVVAGFVDAIGDLLALPAGNPSCVLVALTRTQARLHR
ncbi:hypothetical protein DN069_08840 [Streptacidiphilus pinicola]|uniref:Uncharacterized protein n=1 Tax=Streptacidiphilus pinicola TaxID=2219663 RepID=A0A2X0IRY3_9ACTN|nr:hypothetical protein [Streptacidiphilus pinicola]RAG86001.1 hypothetical protein DN069_08840 [Streptacidiphilus pinicola]